MCEEVVYFSDVRGEQCSHLSTRVYSRVSENRAVCKKVQRAKGGRKQGCGSGGKGARGKEAGVWLRGDNGPAPDQNPSGTRKNNLVTDLKFGSDNNPHLNSK